MKLRSVVLEDIEYREKWLLGLNLRQLLFLSPFILLGYSVLMYSEAPASTRIITATVILSTGLYFVHANYDQKLGYFLRYATRRKRVSLQSTHDIFQVGDIRDDLILTPNKLTAVIRVTPSDFAMKSGARKETTIRQYHNFLNSLGYPVKMLLLIRKQNVREYFSNLKEKAKPKMEEYIEDLQSFYSGLVKNRELFVREYYLIILHFLDKRTDYDLAKEELDKRVKACRERLAEAGFASERVKTSELILLFSKLVV